MTPQMPRWRCLRGLSKEGVQLLVGRLLFALLVSASLYIFYSAPRRTAPRLPSKTKDHSSLGKRSLCERRGRAPPAV